MAVATDAWGCDFISSIIIPRAVGFNISTISNRGREYDRIKDAPCVYLGHITDEDSLDTFGHFVAALPTSVPGHLLPLSHMKYTASSEHALTPGHRRLATWDMGASGMCHVCDAIKSSRAGSAREDPHSVLGGDHSPRLSCAAETPRQKEQEAPWLSFPG